MIRKRPRFSRFLAYCGVVACVLTVALWVVSLCWFTLYWTTNRTVIGSGQGHFVLRLPGPVNHPYSSPGWKVRARARLIPDLTPYHNITHRDGSRTLYIALYLPFLAFGIPTAVFFIRNRRRFPPGHCAECGYNLTGNVSGMCPECGTEVVQP